MQQLLILLLIALAGGNAEGFKRVKPLLCTFGGEQAEKAMEQAEELTQVIDALKTFGAFDGGKGTNEPQKNRQDCEQEARCGESFTGCALAPVRDIADENILNCLSRYVATGE